jgi:hypothetical protein
MCPQKFVQLAIRLMIGLQGVEMLREIASVDPHDYDQQQKDDAGGIRNVAAFVQELAERCAYSSAGFSFPYTG